MALSDAVESGSLFGAIQGLGAAAGGLAYADLISRRGEGYATDMGTLAGDLQSDAAFRGYGVTTGLGTSSVDGNGNTTVGVGPNQAMMNQGAAMMGMNNPYQQYGLQAAGNAMGMNTAAREQDVYNRAMAMQQPMLDQQRASSNAQEFAAGRGGVMGSQFGGSGEDAAMARAQAQAQNQASFQAMGQAQQEMMNQGNLASQFGQLGTATGQLGSQMYANSFMPMQQQLNAMQVAQNNATMAQTGQLTGTGYGAQLGLGGIQTQVNADKAASELYGNIIASMMNNANSGNGQSSFLGSLFDDLF
jgi:hypothetical protein